MRRSTSSEHASEADTRIDRELAGCQFKDAGSSKGFERDLDKLPVRQGRPSPFVCQD
jgi:hypothetical protein